MKNYFFKGSAVLMVLAVFSMLAINSCKDDPEPIPIPVEDGLYIMGSGTALDSLSGDGLMSKAKNEVVQEVRATLYEMFIAVEAGSEGFNLVNVVGGEQEVWGPGADFAAVAAEDLDIEEPQAGLWRGSYAMGETPFTVPEDGLYHVVVDTELGIIAMAKVEWGLIGGATPGGWSDDTPLTESAFDLNTITFEADEVTMLENEFKFRYSGGWKIFLDADYDLGEGNTGVKANTNFGGSLTALEPGGDNIANEEYAVYAFEMTWSLEDGHSATQSYVRDGEPLAVYPDALFMIGGSLNTEDSDSDGTPDGWQWELTDMPMVPVHSNPHVFWKIVYLEADGGGIKFAPQKEWSGDFGVNAGAGETAGVYEKGGDNVPDVAASGYYMVVVNLLDETVEVNDPMIYGIGDAFDTWDAAQAANLFTVDNTAKTATSPPFTADGDLRIHVAASTLTNADAVPVDWWQAEFSVINGDIVYRGIGDDLAAVPVTAGQTVTLDFTTETGTIQ